MAFRCPVSSGDGDAEGNLPLTERDVVFLTADPAGSIAATKIHGSGDAACVISRDRIPAGATLDVAARTWT